MSIISLLFNPLLAGELKEPLEFNFIEKNSDSDVNWESLVYNNSSQLTSKSINGYGVGNNAIAFDASNLFIDLNHQVFIPNVYSDCITNAGKSYPEEISKLKTWNAECLKLLNDRIGRNIRPIKYSKCVVLAGTEKSYLCFYQNPLQDNLNLMLNNNQSSKKNENSYILLSVRVSNKTGVEEINNIIGSAFPGINLVEIAYYNEVVISKQRLIKPR